MNTLSASTGPALASALTELPDPTLRQVGWGLAWLGSCSGNSIVDLSPEELCELQPLSWTLYG